jgi:hypothetical protein
MRRLGQSVSGAFQIALHLMLYPLTRGWRRQWGSTAQERGLQLPGDEFVPEPQWIYNHAIAIDAPRSAVWPWLVQLGQGRGGFYTYEGLENLVGCQIHNVFEVRPQLQRLPGILTDPHSKQPVDLLLDLRRRRYGASHGVGLPSWSCQD